jgi:hypothetical protein
VFAASHASASRSKAITFTDDAIETAAVVRLFLRLATTLRPALEIPIPTLASLYRFLRKWDCGTLEALLTDAITASRHHHHSGMKLLQVFQLGALLDDPSLRKLAFAEPSPPKLQGNEMYEGIAPDSWSLAFWRTSGLSADHIYAMHQLHRLSPVYQSLEHVLAETFEELLVEARSTQM